MDNEMGLRSRVLELWEEGKAALKSGWSDEALKHFSDAAKIQESLGDSPATSVLLMGMGYAKKEMFEEAIASFEVAMPLPAAFTEAVRVMRLAGKAAMKAGNEDWALVCFNRMLSVSAIAAALRQFSGAGVRWNEYELSARQWLHNLRADKGTIYAWWYERDGAVPNDRLLSSRDYKTLHRLSYPADKED